MTTTVPAEPTQKPSLLIGLHAARANIVPGLIVQSLMLLLVVGYYSLRPLAVCLDRIGTLKTNLGLFFTVPVAILAGAILPELLKIVCFQRGKPTRHNFHILLHTIPFWAFAGGCVDLLYRAQALMFDRPDHRVTLAVIVPKVIVDQFIYNPFFAAPMNTIVYDLIVRGVTRANFLSCLNWSYYKNKIIPCLLATWGVWIPVVSIIYALPQPLQIPLFALALTFWALLLAYMSRGRT